MMADRMRWRLGAVAAAMLAIAGLAVPGAVDGAVPRRVMPIPNGAASPAANDALVAQAMARGRTGDCKAVLALLDPLVARSLPGTGGVRFSAQLLRMPCLASAGRGAEIPPVLAELKAQAPDHPLVQGFQIFVDTDAGRFAQAADGLAGLAERRSPALGLIPGELWRAVAQRLTGAHDFARRDRVGLALAQAGWQPSDHPEIAETLAADGVGTLLADKDVEDARPLLARVTRPGALWDMAIQRRYALLWLDIEARLGPESGAAADSYARQALAAYAVNPSDETATRDAVRAFLALGRLDDVTATAAPFTIAPGMDEQQVEIVLGGAQALAAGGDREAALARLAPFATIDPLRTPNVASAMISYIEMLDEAGRFADALALARTGLGAHAAVYSPFGLVWLRRSETCALVGLHHADEARVAGDALKAAAGDNEAAAVEGLLCAGRDDEAAAIAIAALATPEGTDRIADQFQPGEAIYAHPPSRLRALWARLLARGDVKAAFVRSARILPKPLWPASTPRAVPVLPGAAPASSTT
jgi:hypothetical protein